MLHHAALLLIHAVLPILLYPQRTHSASLPTSNMDNGRETLMTTSNCEEGGGTASASPSSNSSGAWLRILIFESFILHAKFYPQIVYSARYLSRQGSLCLLIVPLQSSCRNSPATW